MTLFEIMSGVISVLAEIGGVVLVTREVTSRRAARQMAELTNDLRQLQAELARQVAEREAR